MVDSNKAKNLPWVSMSSKDPKCPGAKDTNYTGVQMTVPEWQLLGVISMLPILTDQEERPRSTRPQGHMRKRGAIVVVKILVKEIWLEKQITKKRQHERAADMPHWHLVVVGVRCGCWRFRFALWYHYFHPWVVRWNSFLPGLNRE